MATWRSVARVSSTCLVSVARNRYSVPCELFGQMVSTRLYPASVVVVAGDDVVAEHVRASERDHVVYDWQHYLPLIQRKPGALRNGAPFAGLPEAFRCLQGHLLKRPGGDREMVMVDILSAVLTDGLPAVEAACTEAIAHGVHSADVVLNILARQRDPGPPLTILTPAALTLRHAPIADCARYDNLRRTV